jgi:selenocysteine lyase/cysteine desulfurase
MKITQDSYHSFLNENRYTIGDQSILADQTASSFPLKCVEHFLQESIYPYYTNTHSNNILGRKMADYVNTCKNYIKKCVNANDTHDTHAIIFTGHGATGAINHFVSSAQLDNTTVFVSKTEHYSNYLPWQNAGVKVILIDVLDTGLIDLKHLETQLSSVSNRKIVSMSACSNITGVIQNVSAISELSRKYSAIVCFDYAASAPYTSIDMAYSDAIFISPHKFPGGQSTPGLLICKKNLLTKRITPGGGTVRFVSHNETIYSENVEQRESGGTPNIIGIIKIALAFYVKQHYIRDIQHDEHRLTISFQEELLKIQKRNDNLEILNPVMNLNRLPIFIIRIKNGSSYYHYNYIVALLSDLFGIYVRGGVSCAGMYAEKLTGCDTLKTKEFILSNKGVPGDYGFIRITLHSLHSLDDIERILKAIEYICINAENHTSTYTYDPIKNLFKKN